MRQKRLTLLIAILFPLLFSAVHIHVTAVDQTPLYADANGYYLGALSTYTFLQHHSIFEIRAMFNSFRPPLQQLISAPFLAIGGENPDSVVYANLLFMILIFYSLLALGRRIGDSRIGLAAAMIFLSTPLAFAQARTVMNDFPLCAFVALAIWLLAESDGFRRTLPSILVGAVCGLGLLTKVAFPIFIGLPVVMSLAYGWCRPPQDARTKQKKRTIMINILLFMMATVAVFSIWLFPDPGRILYDNTERYDNLPTSSEYLAQAFDPMKYLRFLPSQIFGLLYTFLLLQMVLLILFNRPAALLTPLFLLLPPYLLFSSMAAKYPRYILPLILEAVICLAIALHHSALYLKKNRYIAGIAAFCTLHLLAVTYVPAIRNLLMDAPEINSPRMENASLHTGIVFPQRQNWQIDRFLRIVAGEGPAEPATLFFLRVRPFFSESVMLSLDRDLTDYRIRHPGRYLQFNRQAEILQEAQCKQPELLQSLLVDQLQQNDFIVDGDYSFPGYGYGIQLQRLISAFVAALEPIEHEYRQLDSILLPDGHTIRILARSDGQPAAGPVNPDNFFTVLRERISASGTE